jgi:hypothetical protein
MLKMKETLKGTQIVRLLSILLTEVELEYTRSRYVQKCLGSFLSHVLLNVESFNFFGGLESTTCFEQEGCTTYEVI